VTAKLPERHHADVKARFWAVLDEAGSPAEARRGLEALAADYRGAYPSAMAVIERDLDALVATCAGAPSTASGSGAPTCSSAHSSRSAGARR
jgi:hypothetical protein